jgi:hypothetical protein
MKSFRLQHRAAIAMAIAAACMSQAQAASTRDAPLGYVAHSSSARVVQAPARILLLQDVAPWGFTSNEDILNGLGLAFNTLGSAQMGRLVLSNYSVIIVASDQPQAFYDALKRLMPRVNTWLRTGRRTLQFHGADQGFENGLWSFRLPLGVTGNHAEYEESNNVIKPARPIAAGLPAVITGNSASHTSFNLGSVRRDNVIIEAPAGQPTLLSYCYGRGRVFASGQTVEFAYGVGWDFAPLLVNMTKLSTTRPGC